jgi:PTS system mannose-specific IID component
MTAARHVSKPTLARVFFRALFIQASWNPRGMQNLGFASAMAPALAELHPERLARIAATRRHLELFNCHPYAAAAIVGGAVRLEEEVASGTATPQEVSSFKSSLASPFAALGDGFFWLALRPAAALLAALAQPYLGLFCVPLFLVVYDSVHLGVRGWLFAAGYEKGAGIIEILSRVHIPAATRALKTIAAILAGALAARGVLLASAPHRPGNGILVAVVIVAGVLFLPRVRLPVALYAALALGLALGGGFL